MMEMGKELEQVKGLEMVMGQVRERERVMVMVMELGMGMVRVLQCQCAIMGKINLQ